MPLPSDLLNPISADKPSGENLRYAPIFDKIKEARREDDDVPQGDWARGRKVADWPLTIKLINETLATKTKDLQLTAWLAEAMLQPRRHQRPARGAGPQPGLIENFWDTLYPELEDGDAEFRAGKLQWIGDKLEPAVKQVALTRSRLELVQVQGIAHGGQRGSRRHRRQAARRGGEAIAEGKIPLEEFDKDFDAAPKTLLRQPGGRLRRARWNRSPCWARPAMRSSATSRPASATLRDGARRSAADGAQPAAAQAGEGAGRSGRGARRRSSRKWKRRRWRRTRRPRRRGAGRSGAPRRRSSAEPVDRDDAVARVVASAKFLRSARPVQSGALPDAARPALGRTACRGRDHRRDPAGAAAHRNPAEAEEPGARIQLDRGAGNRRNRDGAGMRPRLAGSAALRRAARVSNWAATTTPSARPSSPDCAPCWRITRSFRT